VSSIYSRYHSDICVKLRIQTKNSTLITNTNEMITTSEQETESIVLEIVLLVIFIVLGILLIIITSVLLIIKRSQKSIEFQSLRNSFIYFIVSLFSVPTDFIESGTTLSSINTTNTTIKTK
jgi:hypothetical protein